MRCFFQSKALIVLLLLATPLSIDNALADATAPIVGDWGGDRVNAVFSLQGVRLEYDCALGLIDAPVRFDSRGQFSVRGTYEPYRRGPDVENRSSSKQAATYDGRLIGAAIELRVRLDGDQATRSHVLEKDRKSKLIRCL